MTLNLWIAAGIVIFCIFLAAFFNGSETALTAASRARMHALEKSGDRNACGVNRLLANRDRLIGAILLGNTLVSIGSSAFSTSVLEAHLRLSRRALCDRPDDAAPARLRRNPAEDAGDQLSRQVRR